MLRTNTLGQIPAVPELVIEEVTDPVEIEKHNRHMDAFRLNSEWLEGHWGDLMPQARGKFVVVAGREAHLADTPEEAWAWADRVHPEDISPLVQYVRTELGPRIYANTGKVVCL